MTAKPRILDLFVQAAAAFNSLAAALAAAGETETPPGLAEDGDQPGEPDSGLRTIVAPSAASPVSESPPEGTKP